MNSIEAAVGQYNRTIIELQARLANAAGELAEAGNQIEALKKEVEALKPKETVPEPDAA